MQLGLFFEFYLRPGATHAAAFEEAFSQIEMADRLGLSINAVHQRLKRLRTALGNCINQRLAKGDARG